ncbi:MAG: NAD kinase [Muribaculaceae bacterium]|nr:NAD kinase [Muribaculaceae bacterium]
MKIAVYGNRSQDAFRPRLAAFFDMLVSRDGVEVFIERSFLTYLTQLLGQAPRRAQPVDELPDGIDVVISLGGDGTFLRAARWVGQLGTPIVGLNTGHLGYLAAYRIDEGRLLIDTLLSGNFPVEHRTLLRITDAPIPFDYPFALNEIAILKKDSSAMISVDALIDGWPLATYQADGLLISTPTGSTGYNLSVGGPIVAPTAPNWVISPIAAHSLTMRPLVVNDASSLTLTTTSRTSSYLVAIDGHSIPLPVGSTITVRRAPFTVAVITRPDHNFADTLRRKLLWGQSPVQG